MNDIDYSDFYIDNFSTYIVGLHHYNEDGELRCDVLKDYLESRIDKEHRYLGYNDDYFLSEDFYYREKIFEFAYSETSTLSLVVDEENYFDTDPVKVYHDVMKDLGYVPRMHKEKVKQIIEQKEIVMIQLCIKGGKYKLIDFDEKKVANGESLLGIDVNIYYKEKL